LSDTFDPFAPSTGLPDDFDAVIKSAWFEFDPEFNNGQTLVLKMELETSDEDFGDHGTGELLLSCGKGWETPDRGATAVRDDGNERKGFHQSTAYFLWIDGAIKCDGAEKVLRTAERGDPRKAAMWIGTAWHVNRKQIDYKGDIGVKDKLVPTRFLGEATALAQVVAGNNATGGSNAGGGGAPTKKVAGPVAKAAKKAAPTQPATTGTGIDAELRTQLRALADGAETHDQFVEQAFELAAVSEDDAVQQAVLDTAAGSIWAEAVAAYEAAQAGG
jgi:hypothetical protein